MLCFLQHKPPSVSEEEKGKGLDEPGRVKGGNLVPFRSTVSSSYLSSHRLSDAEIHTKMFKFKWELKLANRDVE